jgi:hypothetical protein
LAGYGRQDREVQSKGIAFYYPGHVWHYDDWIKTVILFFDGIGILLPAICAANRRLKILLSLYLYWTRVASHFGTRIDRGKGGDWEALGRHNRDHQFGCCGQARQEW